MFDKKKPSSTAGETRRLRYGFETVLRTASHAFEFELHCLPADVLLSNMISAADNGVAQ